MSRETEQFLELYKRYRYEDQSKFYLSRQKEFARSQKQAFLISIGLIFLAALAAALEAIPLPWLRETCLLAAAICPVLSTALAGYNALYAFEQQAKIYQDAFHNLQRARTHFPVMQEDQSEADFAQQVSAYVQEVENILRVEQGQWGQLAKSMRPPEI